MKPSKELDEQIATIVKKIGYGCNGEPPALNDEEAKQQLKFIIEERERETYRHIQRTLLNAPKEDWAGTLGEEIERLKETAR